MKIVTLHVGDLEPALDSTLGDDNPDGDTWAIPDDADVRFTMQRATDLTKVINQAQANVLDAATRRVRYPWQSGDTAVAGKYYAWFEIIEAGGVPSTYPNDSEIVVLIRTA